MATANPSIELNLHPNKLLAIIDSAVLASSEIVTFHYNALSTADLSKPSETGEALFRLEGPKLSIDQRRAMHENWILAKAFQDLLRAVRHALEEAHVFVALLTKIHKVKSSSTLTEFLRPFQSKAASMRFPDLLEAVNEKLDPKLLFRDAYHSLQSARNCLEHRDGVVSKIETHDKDSFTLSIPRMKVFYLRDGVEVEVQKG